MGKKRRGKQPKERRPETAYNVGGESSSTSNTLTLSPERKYDVFLSFAGKDTRLNFTDHLYDAFSRSGIRCFMDNVDLPKGEDINYHFQAIEDSLCAVLVISKNYAKSPWCLDELQKILESQNALGQRVFPIYYNVDPAHVRDQRESFGKAFAELEEKFKEDTTKVQNWRTALSKIGNLSGWLTSGKHEADLIKYIVGDVWRFLSTKLPSFDDNLVGIDSNVADLISLLEIGLDDKRFAGICGVGKTILARVVFEKLLDKFEICCFLGNVKNVLSKEGLFSLQKRLLSGLKIKISGIFNSYIGMRLIRRHLCEKKVLIVLDDIDDMSQLKDLAESPDWFGKGSRIIITTRDRHMLTSIGVESIYEMKTMNDRTPKTAYSVGGESSSDFDTFNSKPEWKYDVFLSFAGKDTRLNFTDHLYEAFIRSGIRCFSDDVDLPKGEDINDLFQVIEDSLCAVLVISKNYLKSIWYLDELQKILESRQKLGQRVFPIFYNVDPADIADQQGSFGEALAKHEEKFKETTTKVQNWRTVLSKIGNLPGWVTRDKHDADLIKNIVKDVWSFLSTKLPSFGGNLVGIDSKVADLISFLEIGFDDKRFVGIWGMGGVGKTTLARVVFGKLSDQFEICCFLENVKDALLKEGLVSLQRSLLSGPQIKDLEIRDSFEGMQTIRSCLCEKKVLLVLDDIEDMSQLKDLAESPDWFGKGSRIIITTRDRHMLTSFGVERIYHMKTMNVDESLQIFSKKAFNKNHPEEKYLKYCKSVVEYAGGLPLALQALGSYLCGRNEEAVWKNVLDKLKQINPHKNILQLLKRSYDGLDEIEQTIFLDIVCLFKHWDKEEVTQILKACDLKPILGIQVLIEKTLLVETEDGRLDMHDLYEDLGLDIIRQKSPNSRLRKFGEIKEVLENNKGSGEIEAIVMDNYWDEDKIKVHPEAFSKMSRLRLLLLNGPTNVPTGLKRLSGALKFLRWPSFPLEALPLPLDELVHLEMRYSNIKQLWNDRKSMNHLKFIDLSGSRNLTETPDFSNVQSLEHLRLSICTSLVKVHESLAVLKELVEVDLRGCENLKSLPSKLETNSLRRLDLGGCKNVRRLPEFGEGMKKLSYLDVSHTAISRLPESLGSLIGLRELKTKGNPLDP